MTIVVPDGAFLVGEKNDFGQDYTEGVIRDMFKVPTPTISNAFGLLRTELLKLPMEALVSFKDLIPDSTPGGFDTIPKAVDTIMRALVENPVFLTFQKFLEFLDQLKKNPGEVIGKIGKDMIDGLQTALDNLTKLIQDILENIWKGVWGIGDVIDGIFNPDRARQSMEELNKRIAEAIAEVIKSGGTVEQFSSYNGGQSLGSRWNQTYVAGTGGLYGIGGGLAKFVTAVTLDGRRMQAVHTAGKPRTGKQRADIICSNTPHVGNLLDYATFGNAYNEIFARSTPDGRERVFARLYGMFYMLGFKTASAGEVILRKDKFKFVPSANYGISCEGRTFSLTENSRQYPPAVDGQGLSGLTDQHVWTGMEVGAGNNTVIPASVAAFGYRDL